MNGSYPFPMYSGIFEPKHYKQIGTALWFFSWCISATTKEVVDEEGVTWGLVHGKKPLKLSELAEPFGVDEKTIRRWIKSLEHNGYIRVSRAPYGIILEVRNSKRRLDKNVHSKFERSDINVHSPKDRTDKNVQSESERPDKFARSEPREWTEMSDHPDKNVHSKKDISSDITATTTADDERVEFEKVFAAFCEIHKKLDIHVKPLDITLMTELIARGIPAALIIKVMRTVHEERTAQGARISSFAYYKNAILEAWAAEKAITEGVPVPEGVPLPPVALGSPPKKLSKAEYFRQKAKEAREREAGRSLDAL